MALLVFPVFPVKTVAMELTVCLVFPVWSEIPVHAVIPARSASRERKVKPHSSSTQTTRKVRRVSPDLTVASATLVCLA